MLSNLFFRFNQLISRWLYRDHKRRRRKPMKAEGDGNIQIQGSGNIIDGKQWNIEASDD